MVAPFTWLTEDISNSTPATPTTPCRRGYVVLDASVSSLATKRKYVAFCVPAPVTVPAHVCAGSFWMTPGEATPTLAVSHSNAAAAGPVMVHSRVPAAASAVAGTVPPYRRRFIALTVGAATVANRCAVDTAT